MAYLQVDLDAIKRSHGVAGIVGVSQAAVMGGLINLWSWCWVEKREMITAIQLEGIVGGGPRIGEALEAFGFLEQVDDKHYRVRGAERYLRLSDAVIEGRRRGGLASKSNLKQYKSAGKKTPAGTKKPPAAKPDATGCSTGLVPAENRLLTSSIDHHSSSIDLESKDSSADADQPPPDPKPAELVYRHWLKARNKPDAPMGNAWGIIGARLKEGFTVEQLKQAADGVQFDDWGSRAGQDEIKILYGDAGQVRKFMDLAIKGTPKAKATGFNRRAEEFKHGGIPLKAGGLKYEIDPRYVETPWSKALPIPKPEAK